MIVGAVTDFGAGVLAVLTATIVLGVGYLVFRFGWDRVLHDQSLTVGGFYLRKKPYKGYNRFRSRKWNMKHTA
jgi:hypothetical protein